jgi:hypothetical protein
LVKALVEEFNKFGIPERIYSDGGPQFISNDFETFCQRNGIGNILSSPYNPQSNGIAENTVKEMKKLIHCLTKSGKIDEEEWMRAILVYLNTPRRPLNQSPSQVMFGRDLRDGISILQEQLRPEHLQAIERRVEAIKQHQIAIQKADRLPELSVDQRVAVQDPISKKWSSTGVVQEKARNRSYHVKLDSGAVIWRNRKFLKPLPNQPTERGEQRGRVQRTRTDNTTERNPQPEPTSPAVPRRSTRTRRKPERYGS